jgi:hypothetical protein
MCFGDGGAQKQADQQRRDEVARQNRIKSGMSSIADAFSGFNDSFFAKRAKDYVDYATPGLEKQAGDARDNLIYALSRTGNLDSSAAIDRNADLTEETNAKRIAVANQGLDGANQLRSQVENMRGNVVAELNATGDSSAAGQAALRNAANLNQPQGFTPLGDLFSSFAQTIGNIGSNAGNGYGGFAGGGRSLFSPSAGSQRVVG